jgi:hypothetical protein
LTDCPQSSVGENRDLPICVSAPNFDRTVV